MRLAVGGIQLLSDAAGEGGTEHLGAGFLRGRRQESFFWRDEHFVTMSGRSGAILDKLSFVTSRGRVLGVGGNGGDAFSVEISGRLCGLEAGLGGHIHCIGVIASSEGACTPLLRDQLRMAIGDARPIIDEALRRGERGMLQAVDKYLGKVLEDPKQRKYRRIKTSAKYYRKHIAGSQLGDALLGQLGFRLGYDDDGSAFLKMPRSLAEGLGPAAAKSVLEAALG